MQTTSAGPLPESRYRRNIARIAAATIASQAIVLGATPVLTRLYAPEDFGALAVFTACHAIVASLFTLKYELSIILPRDDEQALTLTGLTVALSLSCAVVLLLLLCTGRLLLGIPAGWQYLLLPLSAVLSAIYTSAQQWGARARDYRKYARGQILNSTANVGAALALSLARNRFFGSLVVGYVFGLLAASAYLVRGFVRAHPEVNWRPLVQLTKLMHTAREYRRFPLFVLPSSFLATLALSAQPFLLQSMFSLSEIGQYAVASRFLLVPGALVGGAVSEAFRAEFVYLLNRGTAITGLFNRTLARLTAFALPVFLAFFFAAPALFSLVFGHSYHDAGLLSRYLCVGVLAQFVSQPFSYVFVATGRVRLGLAAQTAMTVLPWLGLFAGGLTGGIADALLLSSLVTLAVSVSTIGLAYRCCKHSDAVVEVRRAHHA